MNRDPRSWSSPRLFTPEWKAPVCSLLGAFAPEQTPSVGNLCFCFTDTKEHSLMNHFLSLKSNLFLNFPGVIHPSTSTGQSCESLSARSAWLCSWWSEWCPDREAVCLSLLPPTLGTTATLQLGPLAALPPFPSGSTILHHICSPFWL